MANENSQYSNQQTDGISTSGQTYKNGKSECPCALGVLYLQDKLRLGFAPELPKSQQTEKRRYDYQNSLFVYISRDKCELLYRLYTETIKPSIETGVYCDPISIPIYSYHTQLQIGSGVPDNTESGRGTPKPFISLIRDIDPETLKPDPKNIMTYEFNPTEYIIGYNPKTGRFKEKTIVYEEMSIFMDDLKNFQIATSNVYVHADRVIHKTYKQDLDSKLVKLGEKMGIDLSYHPKNYNDYGENMFNNSKSFNGMASPSSNESEDTQYIENMEDLDDSLPFA